MPLSTARPYAVSTVKIGAVDITPRVSDPHNRRHSRAWASRRKGGSHCVPRSFSRSTRQGDGAQEACAVPIGGCCCQTGSPCDAQWCQGLVRFQRIGWIGPSRRLTNSDCTCMSCRRKYCRSPSMPIEAEMIDGQQRVELTPDFLGESRHEFVAKLAYQHCERRGMPLGSAKG